MLETILRRADVKEFLHEVLTDERFNHKTSPETPEGYAYPKTEYSLMLMMDALIKYAILFNDTDLIDEYILQLRRFMKKCENHRDLVEGVNRILGKMTAVTLKIDPETVEQPNNKRKILAYIYDRYITHGYVFHSFPSIYQDNVLENGLDPLHYPYAMENLKEVKSILEKHGVKNGVNKDLNDIAYITVTDSPALAYHYALSSPLYLSELVATSTYMENEKKYDRGAYYQKNFTKAKENVEQLCRDLELSNKEATVLLETFITEWKKLNVTKSRPTIAFIKRSSLNKHYLKDYRSILETCDKEELFYSIERIMTSRMDGEKRYTPIAKEDIKIITLPSYQQILTNEDDFNEQIVPEIEPEQEEMPERVNIRMEVVNTYGNASIIALLGTLLITLGATITILLTVYKG